MTFLIYSEIDFANKFIIYGNTLSSDRDVVSILYKNRNFYNLKIILFAKENVLLILQKCICTRIKWRKFSAVK